MPGTMAIGIVVVSFHSVQVMGYYPMKIGNCQIIRQAENVE